MPGSLVFAFSVLSEFCSIRRVQLCLFKSVAEVKYIRAALLRAGGGAVLAGVPQLHRAGAGADQLE